FRLVLRSAQARNLPQRRHRAARVSKDEGGCMLRDARALKFALVATLGKRALLSMRPAHWPPRSAVMRMSSIRHSSSWMTALILAAGKCCMRAGAARSGLTALDERR